LRAGHGPEHEYPGHLGAAQSKNTAQASSFVHLLTRRCTEGEAKEGGDARVVVAYHLKNAMAGHPGSRPGTGCDAKSWKLDSTVGGKGCDGDVRV
jgi:hypothetical protein